MAERSIEKEVRMQTKQDVTRMESMLEHEIRLQILRRSAKDLQALVHAVHASLPVELRDIICRYV